MGRFDIDDEVPLREWVVIVDTRINLGRGGPALLARIPILSRQRRFLTRLIRYLFGSAAPR